MNNFINHVTPETADRLKAAGFPQPVPEFGQVWYEPKSERELICIKPANLVDRTFSFMYPSGTGTLFNAKDIVFAPNATDILRELGEAYSLKFSANEYAIYYFDSDGRNYENSHANPHELCALEWLKIHEKAAQK